MWAHNLSHGEKVPAKFQIIQIIQFFTNGKKELDWNIKIYLYLCEMLARNLSQWGS